MGYYDDEEDDDDEDKKVRDLMSEHEAGDLNESDAEKLYSNYDVSTTYEHSDEYPEGTVISQNYDSGSKTIEMVVSLGPENGSSRGADEEDETNQ